MNINILLNKLSKTKKFFQTQFDRLIGRNMLHTETISELEAVLLQADLGTEISGRIIKTIEKERVSDLDNVKSIIRSSLLSYFGKSGAECALKENKAGPSVFLILGVNGVGKTTTIAKLAYKLKHEGKKVVLAAADTFRAAAIEQLELWAKKIDVEIIKQNYKSDPSAVVFDAVQSAISKKYDCVIIDTAGRFHNKAELSEELKKIERTAGKRCEGAPHEKLLIVDAATGQNALTQAKQFHEDIGLTGIIVTKMDGTAKGGILVSIEKELCLPIKFIGTGQELDDLEVFDPKAFVEAII